MLRSHLFLLVTISWFCSADHALSTEAEAKATAMAVVDGLAKHGLTASPVNYSVWYAHLGGENPAMSRQIHDHLSNKHRLGDEVLEQLWRRHCSVAGDPAVVAKTADRLGRLMASLAQQMSQAGGVTERFSGAITEFGTGIVEALSSPDSALILQEATTKMLLETRQMAEQNRSLEGQLKNAGGEIAGLRSDLEEMRREAYTDPLTGIGNRKTFDRNLAEAMSEARVGAQPLALVMIDIDHFKKFNDAHGHVLGDEVLKLVARSLVSGVKGRDTVARYGGEEFGVILPKTSIGNAFKVADQLRQLVKTKRITVKSTGKILDELTMSLGVALLRPDDTPSAMIKRADAALYYAKRNGRDRVADENDLPADTSDAAA